MSSLSRQSEPSRGNQRPKRNQRHSLQSVHRQAAGLSPWTQDASSRSSGHASSAASSWNAQSSPTSIHRSSQHPPTNAASRSHVSTRRVQDAVALPSSRPSFPRTSFHGTGRPGQQGRAAFPKRAAGIWGPATLPEREVVERGACVASTTDHCEINTRTFCTMKMAVKNQGAKFDFRPDFNTFS